MRILIMDPGAGYSRSSVFQEGPQAFSGRMVVEAASPVLQPVTVRYGAVQDEGSDAVEVTERLPKQPSNHHLIRIFAAIGLVLVLVVMLLLRSGEGKQSPAVKPNIEESFFSESLAEGEVRVFDYNKIAPPFAGSARITSPPEGAPCSAVLFLSVGTALFTNQYDEIAQTGYVVVVADPVPGSPVKLLPGPYKNSVKMAKDKLASWVGQSCASGVKHWIVGGHSAGGSAAHKALVSDPSLGDAVFSLDPFSGADKNVSKPGVYWGFSKKSCAVDVEQAARAFYRHTPADTRALYLVENVGACNIRGTGGCLFGHCSFLTLGTCDVCPLAYCPDDLILPVTCKTPPPDDFYPKVAQSFASLVSALETGNWDQGWSTPPPGGITLLNVYTGSQDPK